MKIPEFIPFKFGKFESNLQRRMGAVGIGRWALLRKAVGETENLCIDINDMIDRETLELDLGCAPNELVEFLEYAADRRAIDQELFHEGTIWVEGLDEDLTSFYRAGKRPIPKRPAKSRNFPRVDPQVAEISESCGQVEEKSQSSAASDGISAHERTNERTITNEQNERTYETSLTTLPSFDVHNAAKRFQEIYSKREGKPRQLRDAYASCLRRMNAQPWCMDWKIAKGRLEIAAAQFMTYHAKLGTETQFVPFPENFLDGDQWETDWIKAASEIKLSEKKVSEDLASDLMRKVQRL